MVLDNNQLNDISSSIHHIEINISPAISRGQSIVTLSFINITHNIVRAPHTTSPKLASITSNHMHHAPQQHIMTHIHDFHIFLCPLIHIFQAKVLVAHSKSKTQEYTPMCNGTYILLSLLVQDIHTIVKYVFTIVTKEILINARINLILVGTNALTHWFHLSHLQDSTILNHTKQCYINIQAHMHSSFPTHNFPEDHNSSQSPIHSIIIQ